MEPSAHVWREFLVDLNLDVFFNPFIPRNHLELLPSSISRWFGYRERDAPEPPALLRLPLVFLATIAGLCLVGGIYSSAPGIADWNPPALIASFGASAILDYNVIRSPLSQPRNVIVGHTLAAIIGVGISKLFQLSPDFEHIQWVAGAVGCACASLVMTLTNTIHPPGGATAVLAAADKQIVGLGWRFVPLILLASSLMTAVACLLNNLARQYPLYWWTPEETGQLLPYSSSRRKRRHESDEEAPNIDGDTAENKRSSSEQGSVSSSETIGGAGTPFYGFGHSSLRSQLPAGMGLTVEEIDVLQRLDKRVEEYTHRTESD